MKPSSGTVRPPFVPFDEQKKVRIYQRNLPHWRQEGVTYFVTFRLADSIPDYVKVGWEEEKRNWLKAHGITYDGEKGRWHAALENLTPEEQFQFQKHFNRAVQSCVDRGLGSCVLADARCILAIQSNLFAGDGLSYHLGDYVIMPNHVHLLLTPAPSQDLEMTLKGIKGASAVACNRLLGRTGTFWQADSYDHIVRSLEELVLYREYVAGNPAMAGITVAPGASYKAEWMDDWLKANEQ